MWLVFFFFFSPCETWKAIYLFLIWGDYFNFCIHQNTLDLCCGTYYSAKSQWLDKPDVYFLLILIAMHFQIFLSKICLPCGSSMEVQIISILWLHSLEVKPYPLSSLQGRSKNRTLWWLVFCLSLEKTRFSHSF